MSSGKFRYMDPDTRVCEDERQRWERPPSSYGSMRSEDEEDEEEIGEATPLPVVPALPEIPSNDVTGLQLIRSEYPDTLFTQTTQQTKPLGACVIDGRSLSGLDDLEEAEGEDDDIMPADSPEPPPPVEPEELMQTEDEGYQPGRPHPEQHIPYVFKNMQSSMSELSEEDLVKFKTCLCESNKDFNMIKLLEGDILDLVDKMIEVLGLDFAVKSTICCLESINKQPEAAELEEKCKRVMIRYYLTQHIIRNHTVIYEGVPRAGKQELLDNIYVEPQISTCGYGGIDPSHELRRHPPSPIHVPIADSFVGVNHMFRLRKDGGQLVRTVLTTGIPGSGLSVISGKFSLDWAQGHFNKDLQFVFQLPFQSLFSLRNLHLPASKEMSFMEVIKYQYHECSDIKYLEEPDCKFLFLMDSFDCYQVALDWEKSPVINDINTAAHLDVLIVNLIRGTLLPAARVWVLGRRGAVSHIPAQFIDAVTEIQGFSDEMKDNYLTRRFVDKELAANIVALYKRCSSLVILCRQPFLCWMVATAFQHGYRYQGYGVDPPKLTPFYIHILVIQTNRKLQHYYGQTENNLKWSHDDRDMLLKMGKMALKMLEKNTSVFSEEDIKEHGLKLKEVTVFSGLCTELPKAKEKKKFCFIHLTFQEFMAAMYVFMIFREEGKNIIDHHSTLLHIPKRFLSKDQTKLAVGLVNSAVERTFSSTLGHYDMFLRFLCGMFCRENHEDLLRGMTPHHPPPVGGLQEVEKLLEQWIEKAPANRITNLKECLRELTQKEG